MTLASYWRQFHRRPRYVRWPVKAALLSLTVTLVLYPRVWLCPTWLERLRNLTSVVDPNAPQLAPLEAQVVAEVGRDAPLEKVLRPVERVVCARIPYAFDWDTWGVMDYVPTVAEVFAQGREDCDGRAVVAASLLRRMGYEAWLVTDLKHTWVVARDETAAHPTNTELMGPGTGEKTLSGGPGTAETRIQISLAALTNLTRGTTFGVAVFPFGRELIILAAFCVVAVQPRSTVARRISGCVLLVAALGLVRSAGASANALAAHPVFVWSGLGAAVAGWLLLVVKTGTYEPPRVAISRAAAAEQGQTAEGK